MFSTFSRTGEFMNNIGFGKNLYNLRKSEGLSQKQLAGELDVTDKSVSKWENEESYPSVFQLVNISRLFNIKIDDLFKYSQTKEKIVHKIVLTGGPCAGKSTALSWLQNEFSKREYCVLIISETATELTLAGAGINLLNSINFEKNVIKLQLEKEKLFEEAIKNIEKFNKFLIICDRGIMDCKPYLTDLQFKKCLAELNLNETQVRDSYDAVFHLVTAAKGAESFYNFNNPARRESIEEAKEMDEKTVNAWIGHPHLRIIDNSTNFESKMKRLLKEVSLFLGEPQPYEIERKFLISYPNIEKLEKMPNCSKVEIIQTYLVSTPNEEVRIRQRGQNGQFSYTKTTKRKVDNVKRIETETRISSDEYLSLMLNSITDQKQVRKTRYCLLYKNQYFEIDIYPLWKDRAIMEIELRDENQKIDFPKFINVIKEVTGDEAYYNKNLAK